VQYNIATGTTPTGGVNFAGAIRIGNTGGSVTITDSASVNNNIAEGGNGGGIASSNSSSMITISGNATIVDNTVNAGDGGGIYTTGSVTLSDSATIGNNTASGNGGGIYADTIANITAGAGVTFVGNVAIAAYLIDNTTDITQCEMKIGTTSISLPSPFIYAYNNCDINYTSGTMFYQVIFDKNDANATDPSPAIWWVTNNETYDYCYGTDFPTSSLPGFFFTGWATDATGGTEVNSTDTVNLTANQTLYAIFITASDSPSIDTITSSDSKITGTGVPGSTVTVTFPDGNTADALVDDNGTWSVENPGLDVGDEISAVQTTPDLGPSDPAYGIVIPADPTIKQVAEGDTSISGTGIPGAVINIILPDGTTDTTNVELDGTWTYAPVDPLQKKDTVSVSQTVNDFTSGTVSSTVPVPVKSYYITATSDAGSTISPKGVTVVQFEQNITFFFSAANGRSISSVTIDGVPLTQEQMDLGQYTFRSVIMNHFIDVKSKASSGSASTPDDSAGDSKGSGNGSDSGVEDQGNTSSSHNNIWWWVLLIILLIIICLLIWFLLFYRRYVDVVKVASSAKIIGKDRVHKKSEYKFSVEGRPGPVSYRVGEDGARKPLIPSASGEYTIPKGEITDKVTIEVR